MKAIIASKVGEPEDLSVEEVDEPAAGEGEVLIDVKSAAVNFPDLLVVQGKYQVIPDHPFSPGKEAAGVISAVGPGVGSLNVGDRVLVQIEYGAFAEKIAVPEELCFPIPDEMGYDEAAAIGVAYMTAHFALVDRAQIQAGETVLVTGASGSVGLAAIQLAKAFGATVIAGLTTMSKEDTVRENGADHVIDVSGDNVRDTIRDDIKAITGSGVDIVIEIVGGDVFAGGLRALNFRGRIVVVGFTGGTIPTVKTNYLLLKNIAVTGVNWAEYRDRDPAWGQRAQSEVFRMYLDGKVTVPVQASFPMADYIKAFDIIRNREVRGKVVLEI